MCIVVAAVVVVVLFKLNWIYHVYFRLVHLDGSLADLSMIKPEFNSSVKDEEIEEKVDLNEDEVDIKVKEEEDEEICDVFCKTQSFSCHILSEPEPDQGDGNFYTTQSINYYLNICIWVLLLYIFDQNMTVDLVV